MRFEIMDSSGHSVLEFTEEQKTEALDKFMELIGEGRTAATRVAGSKDYSVIRDPAKIQDETVFIPRMQGG